MLERTSLQPQIHRRACCNLYTTKRGNVSFGTLGNLAAPKTYGPHCWLCLRCIPFTVEEGPRDMNGKGMRPPPPPPPHTSVAIEPTRAWRALSWSGLELGGHGMEVVEKTCLACLKVHGACAIASACAMLKAIPPSTMSYLSQTRPGIRRNVRKGGLSRTMASERICPPASFYALEALSLGGLLTSGSWSSSNFFMHWRRLERGLWRRQK